MMVIVYNGLAARSGRANRRSVRYPDPLEVRKEVGRRVKELRKARGLTQAAVAAQLETSTQRVQYIEAGKANLRLDTLIKLANVLDCGIEELLGGAARAGGSAGATPAAKKAGARKGAGRK